MNTRDSVQVVTLNELLKIRSNENISISSDIDCEGKTIPYISDIFRGSIEGNNHIISNLVLSTEIWGDEQAVALFHYLSHATISNLRFKNFRLELDKNGYTPRIAGLCYECGASIIQNVSIELITNLDDDIPLVYVVNSVKLNEVAITCNGKSAEIINNK